MRGLTPRRQMTDHGRGWVDAQLRVRPPWQAEPDYIAGYREGLRSRVADALAVINEIAEQPIMEQPTPRKEHRSMITLGKHAPFTCAPHPMNNPKARPWNALPLVLGTILALVTLVMLRLVLGLL